MRNKYFLILIEGNITKLSYIYVTSVCVCAYNKGPVYELCLLSSSPHPLPPFSIPSISHSSLFYALNWNRLEGGALRLYIGLSYIKFLS